MHKWSMITPLAIVCFLLLAGCTTGSGSGKPRIEGAACVKACDAAMDACSSDCDNRVDDNLCSQECLDRLATCTKRCEQP